MEIRTLKYFLAIAREENMTNAANLLHVSQSALSRQMSDLEEELGTQLFIRHNRKMLLTDDGMHLRKRAEEIVCNWGYLYRSRRDQCYEDNSRHNK